jgi:site-specific recombinase XerD
MNEHNGLVPDVTSETAMTAFEAIREVPREVLWQANYDSVNTQETYSSGIKRFMLFLGIRTTQQLRQVTQAHVIAFKKHLLAHGYKPRTINTRLTTLSSMFNDLVGNQALNINPVQGVRRLPLNYDRVEAKTMTPEQVRVLLDAPDQEKLMGKRDYAILCVLFFTGCRVSEVTTLKVADFYEEDGYDILDFWIKGGKRNRLAVHLELAAAVKEYLAAAGHGQDKDRYLFLPVRNAPAASDPHRKLSRGTVNSNSR